MTELPDSDPLSALLFQNLFVPEKSIYDQLIRSLYGLWKLTHLSFLVPLHIHSTWCHLILQVCLLAYYKRNFNFNWSIHYSHVLYLNWRKPKLPKNYIRISMRYFTAYLLNEDFPGRKTFVVRPLCPLHFQLSVLTEIGFLFRPNVNSFRLQNWKYFALESSLEYIVIV